MFVTLEFPAGMCSKAEEAIDGSSFDYRTITSQRPVTQLGATLRKDDLSKLRGCLDDNGLFDVRIIE